MTGATKCLPITQEQDIHCLQGYYQQVEDKREIEYKNNKKKINRVYNIRYGPRRMYWAPTGKTIYLPYDPRTGVCKWCGFIGYTQMHHEQYHLSDPTKGMVELCASCHRRHHALIQHSIG